MVGLTVLIGCMGQLHRLIRAAEVSAQPAPIASFGRYCCKSPKLPGDNFPAIRRSGRRPPICVVSITLPRSPVSLSSGDEVPIDMVHAGKIDAYAAPRVVARLATGSVRQAQLKCPNGVKLRHSSDVRCTTALPPKAEVHRRSCYVAEVPEPDSRSGCEAILSALALHRFVRE